MKEWDFFNFSVTLGCRNFVSKSMIHWFQAFVCLLGLSLPASVLIFAALETSQSASKTDEA